MRAPVRHDAQVHVRRGKTLAQLMSCLFFPFATVAQGLGEYLPSSDRILVLTMNETGVTAFKNDLGKAGDSDDELRRKPFHSVLGVPLALQKELIAHTIVLSDIPSNVKPWSDPD